MRRVGEQLGINLETLRNWVQQAEIDEGHRPGVTTAEARRISELERAVRELRRAKEILRAASAFFAAAELDRKLSEHQCVGRLRRPAPREVRGRADLHGPALGRDADRPEHLLRR